MTSNFGTTNQNDYNDNSSFIDHKSVDRFELLSAYLDGEVSPAERKQVQQWLDHDPQVQQLYNRLLRLRQGFQSLPTPPVTSTSEELAAAVFQKIDRNRIRRVWLWGSGAIAAVCVGALSFILPGNYNPVPKLAQQPSQEVPSDVLMIAINKPVVEIPKAAVSMPLKPSNYSINKINKID